MACVELFDSIQERCSDCGNGEQGKVRFRYSGPLIPRGGIGYFGPECWEARQREARAGLAPRELGTLPISEGRIFYIEWAKDAKSEIPSVGTEAFERAYELWCGMGMLRDPVG